MSSGPELLKLVKTCLKAFNIVNVQQNQNHHLRQLILKLQIERCRLYVWSFILNSDHYPEQDELARIDIHHDAVRNKLESLLGLFTDLNQLKQKYGFKQYLDTSNYRNEAIIEVRAITVAFDYFSMKGHWDRKIAKLYKKSNWTIQNRWNFSSFIFDVRELIDALQDEMKDHHPVTAQNEAFLDRVLRINSEDTLNAISEASQETYLYISTATAKKSESLRAQSARRLRIEDWLSYEEDTNSHETTDGEDDDGVSSAPTTEHRGQAMLRPNAASSSTFDTSVLMTADASVLSEFDAASEDTFVDHRAAQPIVIPMQIRANAPSALGPTNSFKVNGDWGQDEGTALGSSRSTVLCGTASDEESTDVRSESSITVIAEPSKDKECLAKSGCSDNKSKKPQQTPHPPTPIDKNHHIANGFMHFTSLNSKAQKLDDYFVIDLGTSQPDLKYLRAKGLGHSHYVEVRQVARIVCSSSYTPFDLRSWPRDLHISEFVEKDSIDLEWVKALRSTGFQANVFASPRLKLPFCSGPDGGCLRQCFEMLVDSKKFARLTPTIAYSFERAPEVFAVPVGKLIPLPRFITFCSPTFKPRFDMLMILLVFSDGSVKAKSGYMSSDIDFSKQ